MSEQNKNGGAAFGATAESRATTHADNCWSWGPKHYKCAVREIRAKRAEVAAWRELSDRMEAVLDQLQAENERLRAERDALTALAQQSAAPSEDVNVAGMPEFDSLLDHIYEYGTGAEGVIERANAFARAVIARYLPQQPTEIKRDRPATTLQAEVEALRAEVDGTIRELLAKRDQLAAALEAARGKEGSRESDD